MVQTSFATPYNRPDGIDVASMSPGYRADFSGTVQASSPQEFSKFRDPVLLQAARLLYYIYLEIPHLQTRRPLGVVINRETYRSLLIFKGTPVLLPQEYFLPLDYIESQQYD